MRALPSILLGAALATTTATAINPPEPVRVEVQATENAVQFRHLEPGDEGRCGLIIETGTWDPHYQSGACPAHDDAMTAHKNGEAYQGNVETQVKFVGQVLATGLWGAFAAVTALPYALLGGVGGGLLWAIRDARGRTPPA